MRDLHVKIDDRMYRKFKAATKTLGVVTMSAYLRQKIFEAIAAAEEIDREVAVE